MRRILVSGAATFAVVSALALAAMGELVSPTTSSPGEPAASPVADPGGPGASAAEPVSSSADDAPPEDGAPRNSPASRAAGRPDGVAHDELTAARDAVAAALQRQGTGNFVVDIDTTDNRLAVIAEATDEPAKPGRGDDDARDHRADRSDGRNEHPGTRGIHADDRVDRRVVEAIEAAVDGADAKATDPGRGGNAGAGGDAIEPRNGESEAVDVEVAAARDITIEALGDSPTDFPPYEAGLHIDVGSGNEIALCTSGYAFTDGAVTYGSTAGHCGRIGDPVTVGSTVIDTVALNPFQGNSQVQADAALYSLANRGWTHRPVLHGQTNHTAVVDSLADREITPGVELCFAGRATPEPSCGPVNAAHRVICCDANDKSFVFSCTNRPARAGDSGTAVFRRLAAGRMAAAGLLSSSVTIDGQSSMCFSTIDSIESETGTTVVTVPAAPLPPVPAPVPAPEEPAPAPEQPAPRADQPASPAEQPAPLPERAPSPDQPTSTPAPPAEQPTPPAGSDGALPTLGTQLGRVLGR